MSQTAGNLKTIFEACRTAAMQHAAEGENRDRSEVSRCFRALALARRIHTDRIEPLLVEGARAIPAESVSIGEAAMTAAREGERMAETVLRQIMLAEKSHPSADACAEVGAQSFHVCRICGFIARKSAPERCPVCRAVAQQFQTIE